jgi:hypothetical protein
VLCTLEYSRTDQTKRIVVRMIHPASQPGVLNVVTLAEKANLNCLLSNAWLAGVD